MTLNYLRTEDNRLTALLKTMSMNDPRRAQVLNELQAVRLSWRGIAEALSQFPKVNL